jgi:nucleoside-diphosphate-sugar epimerase
MTMKIGLTGSSGLIGSKFLEKFGQKYIFHKFIGNMINLNDVDKFMKQNFDVVIHLASIIPKYDKDGSPIEQSFTDNVIGTENICKKAAEYNKRIIFTSTQRVYKTKNNISIRETDELKPDSDYGKSKLESENKIQKYLSSQDYTILRISNIYGTYPKRPSIIDNIAESLIQDKPVKIGLSPEIFRDYIHIEDVLDSLELSLNKNGIFNICYGDSFNIQTITKIFENIFKKTPKIFFGNYKPENIFLDNTKSINILNFKYKIDLSTGIQLTVNKIKNHVNKT